MSDSRNLHFYEDENAELHQTVATLEAKLAERDAMIIKLGENAAAAAKEYSSKLAVAREALEPVRDFLIHEVGFEDDDKPLTAILRAIKEIEQ